MAWVPFHLLFAFCPAPLLNTVHKEGKRSTGRQGHSSNASKFSVEYVELFFFFFFLKF